MSELLKVENLNIQAGKTELVKELNFTLSSGKTIGIVGESGSGKSLSSLAILGLLDPKLKKQGRILFERKDLLTLSEEKMLNLRGKSIAMIFQEPMTALNPTMKCGTQVIEVLRRHFPKMAAEKAKKRVVKLFKKVELPRPEEIYNSYPHQISGGQKQRVVIAMAIACNPQLLIADEPTTALDATVQQGILDLLKQLSREYDMGMIFISHDLGVVRHVADDILVMYRGETREYGPAEKVFMQPQDPYTKGLLACRPTPDTQFRRLPVVGDFLDGKRPKLKLRTAEQRSVKAKRQTEQEPMLQVTALDKLFSGKSGFFKKSSEVAALQSVDLQVFPGESLGLVGESGSGKTTLGRILCGLEHATAGTVFYKGKDITNVSARQWRKLHREIQIIFQDPFSALNPRMKIGEAIREAMQNAKLSGKEKTARAKELLEKVGLDASAYDRYPHEFSGGQRQRVGIARALAVDPEFIVCDESVSALDVSVQAQVLNLLNDLKDEFKLTYLFISHDLSVVKYFCDRILVLQNGKLVESGLAEELYHHPETEYTRKLIESAHV